MEELGLSIAIHRTSSNPQCLRPDSCAAVSAGLGQWVSEVWTLMVDQADRVRPNHESKRNRLALDSQEQRQLRRRPNVRYSSRRTQERDA